MSIRPHRGALVANPGSVPEMVAAATGLAGAGALDMYCAPVIVTPRLERRAERLPAVAAGPLLRQMRRRRLPAAVSAGAATHAGTSSELAVQVLGRLPLPLATKMRIARAHNAAFDAAASRRVDQRHTAVIAVAGAAWSTFEAARRLGVPTLLDCPTPHHRFIAATVAAEAELVPADVAATLMPGDLAHAVRARLDQELELADRIFVLSSFHRSTFLEAGVSEGKMVMTPLGVDLEMFRPTPRTDDGVFRVLFVGAMTQRKGLSYLATAVRQAGIAECELVCVGRRILAQDPWSGAPGVRYLSPVPRDELRAVYATADVYVLPSLIEGFPQTALEAMACGLPVIVTTNTFAEDVVTHGADGYIVPIRDSDAIARALLELHRDPELRRRMGAAARARAEQFSWARYGERIADVVAATARA